MGEVVGVVLARGLGRRMREVPATPAAGLTPAPAAAADAGLKTLMPMSADAGPGRPFLDYVLCALADAGLRTVALVVAPEHDALRRHYDGPRAPSRLTLEFVVQDEPLGTADAVRSVEAFAAGRPFVVVNADNLYPVEVLRTLRGLEGPGLSAFERDELAASSHMPPDRVAAFALVTIAADGTLLDVVEKPGAVATSAAGPRALVSMNCWKFDSRIFEACRAVKRSPRGEFELPAAVRLACSQGVRFCAVLARGPVFDLSHREDVAAVAARLAGVEVRL